MRTSNPPAGAPQPDTTACCGRDGQYSAATFPSRDSARRVSWSSREIPVTLSRLTRTSRQPPFAITKSAALTPAGGSLVPRDGSRQEFTVPVDFLRTSRGTHAGARSRAPPCGAGPPLRRAARRHPLLPPLFGQPAKLAASRFLVGAYGFLEAPVPAPVNPVSDNGWLRSESPSPETLGPLIHFVLLSFLVSVMWRSNWPAGSWELSEAAGNARIVDFSTPHRRMNSGLRPAQGQRAVGTEMRPPLRLPA